MEVFAQYAFGVDLGCIEGHGGAGATFAHAFDGALQARTYSCYRWQCPGKHGGKTLPPWAGTAEVART
jgi:hypothetical protein